MPPYSRINPNVEWQHPDTSYSNGVPLNDVDQQTPLTANPSTPHNNTNPAHERPGFAKWGRRTSSGLSLPKSPWEHQLTEKHLRKAPSSSDTVRYFDRRRQTRRVLIDCFIMWLGTLVVCLILFGILYGFSTITTGLSQGQKEAYNALITGFSIILGLAFSGQFKQYASLMRWRFLSSAYRSPEHFEDVLDCESYRSTFKIIFTHWPHGKWYPSKTQLVALFWFIVFVAFNVFTALIGLTYSIDVSDDYVYVSEGNVSVADLRYIANTPQPNNGKDYRVTYQEASANLWGQLGQNFDQWNTTLDDIWAPLTPATYGNDNGLAWARFIDLSPNNAKVNVVTPRTVTSNTVCQQLNLTYGGYAGYQNSDDASLQWQVEWYDENGNFHSENIQTVATGVTTWMGNSSSACGIRCTQLLALQSANNLTVAEAPPDTPAVPVPQLWACNNTVSEVSVQSWEGFADPDSLKLPDLQAEIIAGAIGWNGVTTDGSDLQFVQYSGDTVYNLDGNVTAYGVAYYVEKFTVGALAAMDNLGGPRINVTGAYSPSPAQVLNVQWPYTGAILAGIPTVQFLMMLFVAWWSGKAIILEPSSWKIAHLLKPAVDKMGGDGALLSADELVERLGENYRIMYGVRPNVEDPGHHDDAFVRHVGLVEEGERFGKLTRGKMPQGRYD